MKKEFSFKDLTHEEMIDQVDQMFPITLKYNEDLVNRIYNQYPSLSKTEIAEVIAGIFNSWRDNLILGKELNFKQIFFLKMTFLTIRKVSGIFHGLRMSIKTPQYLRKS